MTPLELVKSKLEALGKIRSHGGYYSTHCPDREDRRPSLLFGETEHGRVWFKDMAGQSTRDSILSALGLRPDDLGDSDEDWQPSASTRRRPRLSTPEEISQEQQQALTSRAEYYHSHVDKGREYWHSQGINDESIDLFRLGYANRCPTAGFTDSYSIPYLYRGQVINLRHRLIDESKGRYRPEFAGLGSSLFNIDSLSRSDGRMESDEAVLVEGEKKAIVLHQVGFRVAGIAGQNAWKPEFIHYFIEAGIERVYVALDPGATEAGKAAADLRRAGLAAVIVSLPDKPDDLIVAGKDPAELLAELHRAGLSPEALARKAAALAAAGQRKAEHDFLNQPTYNPDVIPFDVHPDNYVAEIIPLRQYYTAQEWKEHVESAYPELDPTAEYLKRLTENRNKRAGYCGHMVVKTLPDGRQVKTRHMCDICDNCKKVHAGNLRRKLESILAGDEVGGYEPLDITVIEAETNAERKRLSRRLRDRGLLYKVHPVADSEGDVTYKILVGGHLPEEGAILEPAMVTDDFCLTLISTPPGEKKTGHLYGNTQELKAEFKERNPFECDPDDPDAIGLKTWGVILKTDHPPELPKLAESVENLDQLQDALSRLHFSYLEDLRSQGIVVLDVIENIFYTSKKTLSHLITQFNKNRVATEPALPTQLGLFEPRIEPAQVEDPNVRRLESVLADLNRQL